MFCGFVSIVVFGMITPTSRLEVCQPSKPECQAYVSQWLASLPPPQKVWNEETKSYSTIEIVGARNSKCALIPRQRPA